MTASVKITNIGKHLGKETVLWYVVDPEATITQPIKKLKYFEKNRICLNQMALLPPAP